MKTKSLFFILLTVGSMCASEEQNADQNQVDVRQVLVTSLVAFSVYNQTIQEVDESEPKLEEEKQLPQRQVYKPQPKQEKNKRRQQINRRIQQYRRR